MDVLLIVRKLIMVGNFHIVSPRKNLYLVGYGVGVIPLMINKYVDKRQNIILLIHRLLCPPGL